MPSNPTQQTASPAAVITIPTKQTYENRQQALDAMNDLFVYVRVPNVIVRTSDMAMFRPELFINCQYNTWTYRSQVESKSEDDAPTYKQLAAAKMWFGHKDRRFCEGITYAPGKPMFYGQNLNRWKGWGSTPKQGDVGPWNEMLDFLFEGGSEHRNYFEQHTAYPIQHPGAKLATTVVLYSQTQGVGKDITLEAVSRIYGQNAKLIRTDDLFSDFNPWLVDAQLIVCGEAQGGKDKRKVIERIKQFITAESVTLNEKYKAHIIVPNVANYIFTTNNLDAFHIANGDRRFWIWEVPQMVPKPAAFYNDFHNWKNSLEGIAALHWHLLHVDLTGFNPNAAAPMTQAKLDMREVSFNDVERWLSELPEEYPTRTLYTFDDLHQLWAIENDNAKLDGQELIAALPRCGYKKVHEGKQIRSGKNRWRLWTIGTPEEVQRLCSIKEPSELADLYLQQTGGRQSNSTPFLRQMAEV